LKTKTPFIKNETVTVTLTNGTTLSSVTVTVTDIAELTFTFDENSNIVSYFPQNSTISYDNKINGKVISWDSKDKELIVENSYAPINNNYYSKITLNSAFTRLENSDDQLPDIFRVGDVIKSSDGKYVEVDQMTFTNGIDYVSETNSKNSSSIAKYVTKEIAINNPGTALDVRLTSNIKDIENIRVLYKIKLSSVQSNFDDIDWNYFNFDGSPNNSDIANPSNSISGQFEKQDYYQELSYSISNLPEFTSFAIKIVMKTNDPAYVPKVQDIRAVASF
jgi:hypothetical protein